VSDEEGRKAVQWKGGGDRVGAVWLATAAAHLSFEADATRRLSGEKATQVICVRGTQSVGRSGGQQQCCKVRDDGTAG